MLDPTPTFDDIKAKLEEVVYPLKVYQDEVPEDKDIPIQNGLPLPFVAIYLGGPIGSARDKHISGTRNNTTILWVTIQAYAGRADIAKIYKGKIVQGMTGYRPVDGGEMTLTGGNTDSRASNEVRPTQFIAETVFQIRSNLSWND